MKKIVLIFSTCLLLAGMVKAQEPCYFDHYQRQRQQQVREAEQIISGALRNNKGARATNNDSIK
jgi:hypothetical protein